MAKYIDLPNLKENLTNFLNKKINPIYAKKTEIPSNVSELNNDKSYQTAEEVGQAVTDGVARIVAGAPEDFDTLKEMSDWISSHETSAAAMNSAISDNSVAIANHTSNSDIHVTKEEKTKWNKLDSDLKDGTITVAEATKATQDAQGNVINTTYAKKTEVPQGTVVDDALSSTSTNPVQNKVVKAELGKVNSNLDTLEFGEVAGGKNLADLGDVVLESAGMIYSKVPVRLQIGTYTLSWYTTNTSGELDFGLLTANDTSVYFKTNIPVINGSLTFTISDDVALMNLFSNSAITIKNIQIEEGTTATSYEPYIPSVKMLAEENSQQSIEAIDLKMLGWSVPKECPVQNYVDSDGVFHQRVGRVDLGSLNYIGYSTIAFYTEILPNMKSVRAIDFYCNIYTNSGDKDVPDMPNMTLQIFDNGYFYIRNTSYTGVESFKNAMQGVYLYYELETEQTISVDGNEAVVVLKNDLSNLKDGTTQVAKAVADEDGNNIKSTYAKKTKAFIDYSHISVDLNTLTTAPSLISIGYDAENKPSNFYGGYMFVVNAGYTASIALYQILFDVFYNKIYQRKYYHGSWSAWSDITTPQDIETTTLTTTSGTATLYKLGKMRHLVLNNATFSSTTVLTSTDASVGTLYFRAEVLFNNGDDLEGGSASFEDICISGSNMWNATRTATGASPVAVKGATGSATWMVQ